MIELAGNLIIQEQKILLLYKKSEEHWEVPGGKVKEGENPTQAAVREAKEQIGVKTSLEKPFYSGEFGKDNKIFLWHGYLAKIEKGEPSIEESDKFEKKKWVNADELDEISIAPNLEMIKPGLERLLNRE